MALHPGGGEGLIWIGRALRITAAVWIGGGAAAVVSTARVSSGAGVTAGGAATLTATIGTSRLIEPTDSGPAASIRVVAQRPCWDRRVVQVRAVLQRSQARARGWRRRRSGRRSSLGLRRWRRRRCRRFAVPAPAKAAERGASRHGSRWRYRGLRRRLVGRRLGLLGFSGLGPFGLLGPRSAASCAAFSRARERACRVRPLPWRPPRVAPSARPCRRRSRPIFGPVRVSSTGRRSCHTGGQNLPTVENWWPAPVARRRDEPSQCWPECRCRTNRSRPEVPAPIRRAGHDACRELPHLCAYLRDWYHKTTTFREMSPMSRRHGSYPGSCETITALRLISRSSAE